MPLRTSLHRNPSSGRWPSRMSRRREVLSVNMISLPLGDFRHISHIGSDAHADSFGDLSFLKMGHGMLLQSSQSEQNLFLACSAPPKPPRLNLDEGAESPDWSVDQKRKKCSSMPLLDSEGGDDEGVKEDGYKRGNNISNQTSMFGQERATSCRDGALTESDKPAGQMDEESGFSFSLDLGPSILDDVLQVMDKLHS
ncbi:cdc42 effector protein 3-like [Cololabis saira]|uniref:cdc42 effector protein 3-like n=1 Tax=Cololabis saira TaxID=129043 RepID=UPI002AD2A1D1|nr:cdc42 effector protein 3-like [Cololabis saira]XP_061600483.1 cdc42 effector protein 3-like [Cololabis saira]